MDVPLHQHIDYFFRGVAWYLFFDVDPLRELLGLEARQYEPVGVISIRLSQMAECVPTNLRTGLSRG